MTVKRQKTDLPVIGEVEHYRATRGRAPFLHDETPLKYAPIHNFGRVYRGESMAKRARRLLRGLKRLGAA